MLLSWKLRRVVQVTTSLLLTLQIVALAATVIFYFYANKPDTRHAWQDVFISKQFNRMSDFV